MQKRPSIKYVFQELSSKFPFMASLGNFALCPYNEETYHGFHDCTEIVYCNSGAGILMSEEKKFSFRAGDILFISPYTPHYLYKDGEERCRCEFVHMNLDAMFDAALFPEIVEFAGQLLMPFSISPVIKKEEHPLMQELFFLLLEEAKSCKPFFEMSIRGYCLGILTELKKMREEIEKKEVRDSRASLHPALLYMNRHYENDISIPELAEICHISETHFRRLFRNKFHMSPVDYLNHIRIHKACVLLSRKPMLISQVAEQTGYRTLSSFNRNFLEIMQKSPTQWMKEHLQVNKESVIMYYG